MDENATVYIDGRRCEIQGGPRSLRDLLELECGKRADQYFLEIDGVEHHRRAEVIRVRDGMRFKCRKA